MTTDVGGMNASELYSGPAADDMYTRPSLPNVRKTDQIVSPQINYAVTILHYTYVYIYMISLKWLSL